VNKLGRFNLAPGESTPYTIFYSDDLDSGEVVNATTATANGDGLLTIVYAIYTNDTLMGPYAKVMVTGGTPGAAYTVTVTSTTTDGRKMIDTFTVTIK
jgi:hypothetical protein